MTLFRMGLAALTAAVGVATAAHAQTDPILLDQSNRANSTTGGSYVLTTQGEDVIVYSPVFVQADGGSQFRLNTLQVGAYRNGSTTTPAPAVDIEVSVADMIFDPTTGAYGLGTVRATGTYSFTESTSLVTSYVTFTWGATDPTVRPVITLMNAVNGANGYGGFWVGQRFKGPNAASTLNANRRVNEPATGHSLNWFAKYTISTNTFSPGWSFGNDATSQPYPSRIYAKVGGTVTDAVAPPANQLYGRSCASQWYYAPADAYDGVGSLWTYFPQFAAAAPGDSMMPSKVIVPIWRAGTAAAPAIATTVELALVKMTWDATASTYGIGDVVATTTRQLSEVTTTGSASIVWDFPATPVTAVKVNTDNAANPGLGGWWVAARFRGDSTTLAGKNYLRIGYASLSGTSWNGFGRIDPTTGLFGASWWFGVYANNTTASPQPRPARMVAESYGTIGVPPSNCPADLNGDHVVNGADLGLLLGAWGPCPGTPCTGDINLDGEVNGADLGLLLGAWGPCI